MDENGPAASVVNCALEIHKELGPGLLESVYEVLLATRFKSVGLVSSDKSQFQFAFAGSDSMKAFVRIWLLET